MLDDERAGTKLASCLPGNSRLTSPVVRSAEQARPSRGRPGTLGRPDCRPPTGASLEGVPDHRPAAARRGRRGGLRRDGRRQHALAGRVRGPAGRALVPGLARGRRGRHGRRLRPRRGPGAHRRRHRDHGTRAGPGPRRPDRRGPHPVPGAGHHRRAGSRIPAERPGRRPAVVGRDRRRAVPAGDRSRRPERRAGRNDGQRQVRPPRHPGRRREPDEPRTRHRTRQRGPAHNDPARHEPGRDTNNGPGHGSPPAGRQPPPPRTTRARGRTERRGRGGRRGRPQDRRVLPHHGPGQGLPGGCAGSL
jgi:hypothetical protein